MVQIQGTVIQGYGVASGKGIDPRFPDGTIALQKPFFQKLGLDLDGFYLGTINLSIAPLEYRVKQAKHVFRGVKWSPIAPAEDFSFFDCALAGQAGLIYYPHPETKPEHFQALDVLEILTTWIPGLEYGNRLTVTLDDSQIEVMRSPT